MSRTDVYDGTLLRHGSPEQKQKYLPQIAAGELRLQSFAVTEPSTATDTTKTKTSAEKHGDRYVVNGQKVWISRVQHSDLLLLLARTTPLEQITKKTEGLSVFLVDVRARLEQGMTIRPIRNMVNHETNEVFFDNLEVPAANLIGEEGTGFSYILDRLLTVFGEQLIRGTSWQLAHLRMMVGPLSFPLHGLMTSRYRGESAVCLSSGRRGISPLIRASVIKLLCHASPVFPRFRVNGSHLFLPWANPISETDK